MSSLLQTGPVATPPVQGRAVEVTDLTIRSGDRTLVSELSFHIERGERVGLIGESGSGKSLTSLAVMGLLPANLRAEGTVHVGSDERNLVDLGERELAGIRGTRSAMVFQEPMTALNPLMQVGPQIAEAMIVHGTQRDRRAANARALQLLQDVGIPLPPKRRRPTRTSCRVVSVSAWCSPLRWRTTPSCSCATSRRPPSTSPCRSRCSTSCSRP